jgi:cytochrome c oxidase subunit 2
MSRSSSTPHRRILIASSHPLFGQGLRKLLEARRDAGVEVVGIVASLEEALAHLESLAPDLVIVDYDDRSLNRDDFLARFVEGERQLRVVLLSLDRPDDAVVYDRRTLKAAQIDDWLEASPKASRPAPLQPPPQAPRRPPSAAEQAKRRTGMRHFITAAVAVIVVTILLILGLNNIQLLPIQASAQAVPIDDLFHLEFKVIAFLFALIVVFMVYSMVFFRRRKGDLTDAENITGNNKLEIAWTVAPLVTVLAFAYLGGVSLAETVRPDPKPIEVKVTGLQWSWRFEYPELGIISDELILPVNRQALLKLTSADVIHSFWVPEFRVKQDALPGGEEFVRELRITPTQLGEWKVRCAELCGLQHTTMESPVKVLRQADYEAWVTAQGAVSNDPVARGQKASQQFGCLACHSIDGSQMAGPTWKGLAGKTETLQDGSTVVVDEAYLHESIVDPNKLIVQGFPPIMPPYGSGQLTDEQISDIIAYIMSLK